MVRLYNNRRGSDFADVAVVLAERERKLAEAEAQIRRAGEREARLQAEVRAWERRATEPEALLPADVRGPDRTAASVGDQEGVEAQQVGAHVISRASEMEVAPLDCTPSAVEAAADLPRLSPLRTTAADALLAPSLQRGELLPIRTVEFVFLLTYVLCTCVLHTRTVEFESLLTYMLCARIFWITYVLFLLLCVMFFLFFGFCGI